MLSGNGTIDYNVESHTLDAQETSAARQGSTTRNIQGSITRNFQISVEKNVGCVPGFWRKMRSEWVAG